MTGAEIVCVVRPYGQPEQLKVFGDPLSEMYQYVWGDSRIAEARHSLAKPGTNIVPDASIYGKTRHQLVQDLRACLHFKLDGSLRQNVPKFTNPKDKPHFWPRSVPWDPRHCPSRLAKPEVVACIQAYHAAFRTESV